MLLESHTQTALFFRHLTTPANTYLWMIQHLEKTFGANSYPDSVLDPILKGKPTNTPQPAQPTKEGSPEKKILCLPYVRGVTEKIDRVCRNIKTVNLKLITKPHRTIRQTLVNVKNRVQRRRRLEWSTRFPAMTVTMSMWLRQEEPSRSDWQSTNKL